LKLLWTDQGWDDYTYWQGADLKILKRVNEVIRDARRNPFQGIGKPEPLRGDLSGWWSRRIDDEHRLVSRATGRGEDQAMEIAHCRFHYHR